MTDAENPARSPRLILLTQWFDPEPTFKGIVFARALQARGFSVEVVTGFPNYPGGKLYPGYRIRMVQRETMHGIPVTRLPLYPSHDQSALGRVANYVSFFLSAAIYLTFFARRADVVYVYHPPLTVGLAAAFAKLFRRTPTVIDIQDMWPDTLKATGMVGNERLLGIVNLCCKWLYKRASHIVVLSPGFRKLLTERSVPASKITLIYNWADEAAISDTMLEKPEAMASPGKFRVLFAGNMGRAQALDGVIDAAHLVAQNRDDVEFTFMGGGLELEHLKKRVADENMENVRFLPQVPMSQVGRYLAAADCALVHLRADPLFEITIPSKTQAYMAAAKPIIIAVKGDAANLVDQSGCGIAVPPNNAEALATAVLDMAGRSTGELAQMGNAAAHYYAENLSLAKGADHFAKLFRQLIPAKGG